MFDLRVNLRPAIRGLVKSPAYSILVLTTLAIGAGASTAIFSAVNELMLRPLPLPESHRLVMLWESNAERGWDRVQVAPANAMDWREQVPSFEDIALVREEANSVALTTATGTVGVMASAVSGNVFTVLRARLYLGRGFTMDETWAESAPVAVLSHGAWLRTFGADSGIVGKLIRLDGAAHEVVGVLAPAFRYPMNEAEVWTTFRWEASRRAGVWFRQAHVVRAIARLTPGATAGRASRELDAVAARLAVEYPGTNAGTHAGLTPLRDFLVGDRRAPLLLLLGAAGLLLSIVCANVATISLARALARRHEMAIRAALGATTGRLVRQGFIESACLAVAGTLLGLAVGWVGLNAIAAWRPDELPDLVFRMDWRVFAFTAAIAGVSALVFGIQPALAAARNDVQQELEGGRTATAGPGRLLASHLLTSFEVALAVVLVVSAGLMVRSIGQLRNVDSGVSTRNAFTFEVSAPTWKYSADDAKVQLAVRILERVRAIPGVREAGIGRSIPFGGQGWTSDFMVEGWEAGRFGVEVRHRQVTPGYFRALQVPLRQGVLFGERMPPGTPSFVVVNQAFVDAYFGGVSPIGRRIVFDRESAPTSQWHQVVGVVGNERMELQVEPLPEIIGHLATDPPQQMHVVVRYDGGMSSLAPAIRSAVSAVEPEAPVLRLRPMDAVAIDALAADRYVMVVLGVFAVVALVVAAVGVYGVSSQTARMRTHEVGIRIALGATSSDAARALMRRGVGFIGLGIVAGTLATLVTGRLLRTQLFRVEPTDPPTLLAVAALLMGVAVLAILIPARRATRVDPVTVLRAE
ncbi:MAG TPA: ABC transporter permease [Gemmatimonadaceae bacterium]